MYFAFTGVKVQTSRISSAISYCQRLVSVGMDEHAMINIWDWRKGKVISSARGHSDKVSSIFNDSHVLSNEHIVV